MTTEATGRQRAGGVRGLTVATGRGIVYMIIGCALLTLNDALVKWMTAGYPVGQILFVRGSFVFLPIAFLIWRMGGLGVLRVHNHGGQALRAMLVVVATFLFITGLSLLPLADAIAVAFAGPLIATALAPFLLGERVGWRRWSAVIIGFGGILLMARPSGNVVAWAVLLPLGATICGALRDILTRRIAATESSVGILFYTTSAVTIAGAISLTYYGWTPMSWQDAGVLALAAMLMAGAHYLQIEAFRFAEATAVTPYRYTSMVWAILFGYLIWSHLPSGGMLAGAALVIGSGLYIWHRERRLMDS